MIKKPEQVYGNAGKQLYYQWTQGEHHIYQEPVYDHTRKYIESLEAENDKLRTQLADVTESMGRMEERCAKLRKLVRSMLAFQNNPAYGYLDIRAVEARAREFVEQARELGVEEDA